MKQYDALTMELTEGRLDGVLAIHLQSRLSLRDQDGTRRSAMRFVQLEEGERIVGEGVAQDAMLLVLDGDVEISTGRERHAGDRGSVAIIAPYVPFSIHNHGMNTAHLLCLLPQAAIGSVFDTPLETLHIEVTRPGNAASKALTC